MIRFIDMILSLSSIVILSPLFFILFLILKFTGEGEIFFSQTRVGRYGKEFKLFKFATMLKNSPNMEFGTVTVKNDPRILPIGSFLRDTKINELPQLLNVLIGDMSLIGPRPMTDEGYKSFSNIQKKEISKLLPGLSGVASIILRNEESILEQVKNPLDFHRNVLNPYKANLEMWFGRKLSLRNYLILIFLTFIKVFFSRSNLINLIYKDLPPPPLELEEFLKLAHKV